MEGTSLLPPMTRNLWHLSPAFLKQRHATAGHPSVSLLLPCPLCPFLSREKHAEIVPVGKTKPCTLQFSPPPLSRLFLYIGKLHKKTVHTHCLQPSHPTVSWSISIKLSRRRPHGKYTPSQTHQLLAVCPTPPEVTALTWNTAFACSKRHSLLGCLFPH